MDSNTIVQATEILCREPNKAHRNMQNTKLKEKVSNHKPTQKVKKHSTISYDGKAENIDNDVILRMVLPGYNWFEDQVKNNMYMTDAERKITTVKVSTNPRLKIAEQIKTQPEPIDNPSPESLAKLKSSITKRVINSALMLLPNNSLPLKKRKIKENSVEREMEIKEVLVSQTQETKKIYNPPIQKVTPILNSCYPPPSDDFNKIEPISHHHHRPSAFKSDHLLKKQTNLASQHQHRQNRSLDPSSFSYASLVRNHPTVSVPERRPQFHPSCYMNNSFCYQCNMYRYQTSHLVKPPGQECIKPVQSFAQVQPAVSPKKYWHPNDYLTYGCYDQLATTDLGQTFQSFNVCDNKFSAPLPPKNLYQAEQMPLNYVNMTNPMYCANSYWAKSTVPPYKPLQMTPARNDLNNSNYHNLPINIQQQFFKAYNHIG